MAVYAIGDIQGCYSQLELLLKEIRFNTDRDQLWFAGDIINRGPESLRTLRFVKSLGDNAVAVLGNHDLHLLAVANGRGKQGKKDTIKDILQAADREQLLEWLLQRPLLHYDPAYNACMVHAGIYPSWSINDAVARAAEVENILRGKKSHEFFQHMYGDKPPKWSNKLKGWDRLRFITNVFTRMRYCDEKGRLSLREKSAPGKQKPGIIPWFNVNNRQTGDTDIIFGHWSTLKDPHIEHLYPLDTGCLWGGQLSALRIDSAERQLIQVDCPQSQPIDTESSKPHRKSRFKRVLGYFLR